MVQANIKLRGMDNFKKYLDNFLAVCKYIPHWDFGHGVECQ